jgi:hypothetical protein
LIFDNDHCEAAHPVHGALQGKRGSGVPSGSASVPLLLGLRSVMRSYKNSVGT